MKKQLLISALAVPLLLFGNEVTYANDIEGGWYEEYIQDLSDRGIMEADEFGDYYPDEIVTRIEFAELICKSLHLPEVTEEEVDFPDLTGEDEEMDGYVRSAAAVGIIVGYPDGEFKPDNSITRNEATVMMNRALEYKGIYANGEELPFDDVENVFDREGMENVYQLGIINGVGNNKFNPTGTATRGQFAVMISKMLDIMTESYIGYDSDEVIHVMDTYEGAVQEAVAYQLPTLTRDGKKIWSNNVAFTSAANSSTTCIYSDKELEQELTNIDNSEEMQVIEQYSKVSKVMIGSLIGYVSNEDVDIQKRSTANNSYYKEIDGLLYHYISRNNTYDNPYIVGDKPSGMLEGQIVYSPDNKTVNGETYYSYFNYLSARTPSPYTGEQYDAYLTVTKPNSPLIGLGDTFKLMEEKYHVNSLLLLAVAIQESDYGFSSFAVEKNNLFGLHATDSEGNVKTYDTKEICIEDFAKNYLNEGYLYYAHPSRYHGGFLGDKGMGMNVSYSTDPYWGEGIASTMYRIDQLMGSEALNQYELAVIKEDTVVKDVIGMDTYTAKAGTIVTVKSATEESIEIFADSPFSTEGYVNSTSISMINR